MRPFKLSLDVYTRLGSGPGVYLVEADTPILPIGKIVEYRGETWIPCLVGSVFCLLWERYTRIDFTPQFL